MFRVLPLKRCLIVAVVGLATMGCGGEDAPVDPPADGTDEDDARGSITDAGRVDAGVNTAAQKPNDAGAKIPDAQRPSAEAGSGNKKLDALAGRYLMRLDVLGTATSPSPLGGEVAIRSRVSTLIVAELAVDGDQLSGTERVCTQVIAQKCEKQCTSASTSVDSRVVSGFLLQRQQHRTYTLAEDGTFRGERSIAQLGYDDTNEDAAAPTSPDDKRLWDVVPGNDIGEGLLSKLSVTLGLTISCDAYGTQKFASSFSGKLGGSDGAPTIPEMTLALDGSEGTRLGSSSPACDAQEVSSPVEIANARMVRYGDDMNDDAFWNCPAPSVFDQQLPPTEPNLK